MVRGILLILLLSLFHHVAAGDSMNAVEKERLKLKTLEMFDHAYGAYKKYAYPADELMPLSCKGRYRGSEKDRGDIDESLGNFSLTLIDTLDTLVVLGRLDEFETQVRYVIQNVSFNADAIVSVFETNIRVLGGLLGAHTMALALKEHGKAMMWYKDELLLKAVDVGDRLLAAFNTSTGIPYPKVNLRYGVNNPNARVGHETDTCTACAGTMIMEFGALSRMSGKPIYEEKAHKAMDALWKFRSRHSDLVGTTINIHNGNWIRRDSGIGAGIDSYYEYCLKAYILLGDESYLDKFNKHYAAINKYIRQGYMLTDVLMHQPDKKIRNTVDSLQAFWPGLQVLKGDLKPAIETHEMLYTVAKKFKFLPEAFTTNFEVHWGQHPLRPEFVESTYFLYQATKDPYYLIAGKHVLDALDEYARVPCGFAAFSDLRTLHHEDKMDSFVLAETFKYLYLLFSEETEHQVNIHDYIFTTEAHLLPLYLSVMPSSKSINETKPLKPDETFITVTIKENDVSCPNERYSHSNLRSFAEMVRQQVNSAGKMIPPACNMPNPESTERVTEKLLSAIKISSNRPRRLKAGEFVITNQSHLAILKDLGISLAKEDNGKVQLIHQAALARTTEDAREGVLFMQEMMQLAKLRVDQGEFQSRSITITSSPHNGKTVLPAGSAQFGPELGKNPQKVTAEVVEAVPFRACQYLENKEMVANRIVVMERGDCMFIDKVRLAQSLNALGVIIVDHTPGTSAAASQAFGMSGDSTSDDVKIPSVFLFHTERELLRKHMNNYKDGYLEIKMAAKEDDQNAGDASTKSPIVAASSPSTEAEKNTDTSEEVLVDDQGRQITTTTTTQLIHDDKGVLKKRTQKTIRTCPTIACDKDVKVRVLVTEDVVQPETKDDNVNTDDSQVASGVNDKGRDDNKLNPLNSDESTDTKDKLNDDSEKAGKTSICTSAGCFSSFDELRSMNKLAGNLINEIQKLQEQLEESGDQSSHSKGGDNFIYVEDSDLKHVESESDASIPHAEVAENTPIASPHENVNGKEKSKDNSNIDKSVEDNKEAKSKQTKDDL